MVYIAFPVGQEKVMAENKKQTGPKAATAASDVLRDPKATGNDKKAAASALSQTPTKDDK
jgi:hypothetical protein